jgi:N-acetylmuramidase/Putative peptidoglycan binding domain
MTEFAGRGTPLTQAGFVEATADLDVGDAELWAVIAVETSGCGFLADRRPKILFERHWFSSLSGGQFDAEDPDISAPTAGGYGPSGAHQYDRLAAAMRLDREAALKSASWGLGQILGWNFGAAGFADVDSMVAAMVLSEDKQLKAMAGFIEATGMNGPLAAHQWSSFARRYNGPDYAAHNYDGQLADAFQRYSARGLPDLEVRRVQIWLMYRGISPGAIDGLEGPDTTAAVTAFQRSIGKPETGRVADAIAELEEKPQS